MVAIDEAEVEIWYALAIASAYEWMVRAEVAYEAVAYADLTGVGFGLFFLAAMVGCDSEHLARDHAVESSDWIEDCAYRLALNLSRSCRRRCLMCGGSPRLCRLLLYQWIGSR